jgi:hypothetical protein
MFMKISRPAHGPVFEIASPTKPTESRYTRDDRCRESAKRDLADMLEAYVASLDAVVRGFPGPSADRW